MKINEKLIIHNFSSRRGETIKYIVVHDTGNTRQGANAEAHYNYFNSEDRQSSAHYFVDDTQILRVVKDTDKSWHCGDGGRKYGISNENSIGIEMCINSDGDFEQTKNNTLGLIKYLMKEYNISINNVVRHYDASRKICPYIMSKNNWKEWKSFINELKLLLGDELLEDKEEIDYTNILKLLYKNIFDRNGDEDGICYYNNKLNSGYTLGDVLKEFGESEEFKEKYII